MNIAQEVRDQKREECSMLAEALLDAETRIGDLLKQLPKQPGKRTDLKPIDSSVVRLNEQKPKHEVITDLGFSQKQAERFETLGSNKDLVEQVKAEARENDDIPTRTRVLELAKARKQKADEKPVKEPDDYKEYCVYIDEAKKVANKYLDFLHQCSLLTVDDKTLSMWKEFLKSEDDIARDIKDIGEVIPKLLKMQNFLKGLSK